jgi:heterodisulfide reductase subunit C
MAKPMPATSAQLAEELMEAVLRLPDGGKIKACIQCGTCSGACPTSYAMDYTPREIIAALRAGMLDRVVNSNTVWMCSSCYGCTVRCPAGIKLTDVMYQLKSLAMRYHMLPRGNKTPALQKSFVAEVESRGRNSELGLMRRFFLSTSPLAGLKNAPLGWALFRRGRLALRSSRVSAQGRQQLRAIAHNVKGGS